MKNLEIPLAVLKAMPISDWTGYLWYDNATAPEVFTIPSPIDFEKKLTELPFVIEGYLYRKDQEEIQSLSIHNYNGDYRIHNITSASTVEKDFIIHKIDDDFPKKIKGLRFKEVFGETEDFLGSEFKEHRFQYRAFLGFEQY